MRTFNANLMTMLAGNELSACFQIELDNGVSAPVYLTSHDVDQTVGSVTYLHDAGFDVSKITIRNGGDPAGVDISLPISSEGPIYTNDVKKGLWRGADATLYLADFASPSDRQLIATGYVGMTEYTDRLVGKFPIITKARKLDDIVLVTVQTKCQFAFGGARCGVNLAAYTTTGTVSSVTDNGKFIASVTPLSPVKDFTHGKLTFTSGNNAGASRWVRLWTVGTGQIELTDAFPLGVAVSDAFAITAGCQRDATSCDSFGNLARFPGFEYVAD